jgi:hypothetical protein
MNHFLVNPQIEDQLVEHDVVVMKYYCANNDTNGNPRRLFALVQGFPGPGCLGRMLQVKRIAFPVSSERRPGKQ